MKIVADDGTEQPWDGEAYGALRVRGPWICSGYYRREDETGDTHDADGWFATGDVATIDPDGFMAITDRTKDVIKSGGEWISSIDLENTAVGHPDVAEAAVRWLGRGVVAFDLAGAETGFPPSDHTDALDIAHRGLAAVTIHASERPGLELIADALRLGAQRIGHGVLLIEDCTVDGDGDLVLGSLARYVRDRRIPLELCPSCNVQIGAVPTIADHPVGPFLRAGIVATVNTDNRLMSGVSVSSELGLVADTFDLSWDEVRQLQRNAAAATFADHDRRSALLAQIDAGFASLVAG